MSESSHWLVMDSIPFELLPGEAEAVEGDAKSYYEYLNKRSQETGKNVQAMLFALGDVEPGQVIEEPFGGVGVFSVALNVLLSPSEHRILELDEGCFTQLMHLAKNHPSMKIKFGDAHDIAGILPADIYVCDFPFFTMLKFWEQRAWRDEMDRMISHWPDSIVVTDGTSFNYHLSWPHLHSRDANITADRESYIRTMSRYYQTTYDYGITRCGWHGTCFYYNLEPGMHNPQDIEFKNYPSGSGTQGLRLTAL